MESKICRVCHSLKPVIEKIEAISRMNICEVSSFLLLTAQKEMIMKQLILAAIVVLMAGHVFAKDYMHVWATYDAGGTMVQGFAPDPLKSVIVPDNSRHNMTLFSSVLGINIIYNGTGGCIFRLLNTNATSGLSSTPTYVVPAAGSFGRIVNQNALFGQYSGCYNSSPTAANPQSIIEKM
jgi:hypothetical protein